MLSSLCYILTFLPAFTMHPIYASNPKYYFAPYIGWYTHAVGWPAAPTAASEVVWNQYIIPDTAASHATGKAGAEEAVKKAEAQIQRLYRRHT
jgi:hypothetical protein